VVERRPTNPVEWAVAAAVVVFLAGIVVLPLFALVWTVARSPLAALHGLSTHEAVYALGLSAALAAISLAANGAMGVVGGLVLVRQRFAGRRLLDGLVDLPLAVSPVMTGLGFLLLFGRNGILGPVLERLDLQVAFAVPGAILATLFVTLPFTVREVALVLYEVGMVEEEAAETLGASALQTFWRVTVPKIRHGMVIGATLTVARALGEFGAVLVLGGAIANRTMTATTFIHAAIEGRQAPAAYGMALVLAAASIALLGMLQIQKRPAESR
jgi:sulfate transport system permease protein